LQAPPDRHRVKICFPFQRHGVPFHFRRAGTPVEEPTKISKFWQDYYELANAVAPELKMKIPTDNTGTTIFFRPDEFPVWMKLIHKAHLGAVVIQMNGMGPFLSEVGERLGPLIEANMVIERTHKSAAVKMEVPVIDMTRPLSDQKVPVLNAIHVAQELHRWGAKNLHHLVELHDKYTTEWKKP